jgi:hypothetical protein
MKGINSKKKGAKEEGAKTIFDFQKQKTRSAFDFRAGFRSYPTNLIRYMVHSGGFEPPTARFVAEYSIQLSYECVVEARILLV